MSSIGRRLGALTAATAVILSPLAVGVSPAAADTRDAAKIHTVTPSNLGAEKWTQQAYDCGDANGDWLDPAQSFEPTPNAPMGHGAAFITMGAYGVQTELSRTALLDNVQVADIKRLDYSTFAKPTGSATATKQPAYLRLSISSTGNGIKDTTLNFEPANNSAQAPVQNGVWQGWNTAAGKYRVVEGPGETPGDESASFVTLAEYASRHEDATLANNTEGGALSIVAGCSGTNQTSAKLGFDRVAVDAGNQTFLWDFETTTAKVDAGTAVVKNLTGDWNASAFNLSGNGGNGSITPVRQTFVVGPKTPSAGKGSIKLEVGDNSDATQFLRSTVLDNKPVSALRELSYSSYAKHVGDAGAALQQPAYLRLSISSDGSGSKDTTLNYEPANNGQVENDRWQNWNAFDGKFRVVEGDGETAGNSPASFLTLAAYMTRHPEATFATNEKPYGGRGALSFVVGAAGDQQRNGEFGVDNVSVGTYDSAAAAPEVDVTTYDFEADYTVPTVNGVKRNNAGPVTLTGTAGAGDKVEIRSLSDESDYSNVLGTVTADDNGKWSLTPEDDFADTTTVKAWLAGTYGETDIASAPAKVEVVYTAPTVNNANRSGPGSVTLTGTAFAGDSVEVRALNTAQTSTSGSARAAVVQDYSTVLGTAKADASGKWSLTKDFTKTTTVKAWLAGTYGQRNIASAPATVQISNVAPTVNNVKRSGAGPVTLTGSGAPGDKLQLQALKGDSDWTTVLGTATVDSSGTWSLNVAKVTERTTVRAKVVDSDTVSANARIDVVFAATLALSTKGGFVYGTATLNPAHAGVTVRFQTLDAKKQWKLVSLTTTNAKGIASLKWDTVKGRAYTLRVVVSGTAKAGGIVSSAKAIKSS
jgi:hypothetical protein